MKFSILFFVGFSLFLNSCLQSPEYPIEPQITFKGISKTRMLSSLGILRRDSLLLTLSFTDGDGDLGTREGEPNRPIDLFVVDLSSPNTPESFTLPYVAPRGAIKAINGDIRVALYSTCCTVQDVAPCQISKKYPLDSVFYEVYIKDRAGNKSNVVKLPPIELICNQ